MRRIKKAVSLSKRSQRFYSELTENQLKNGEIICRECIFCVFATNVFEIKSCSVNWAIKFSVIFRQFLFCLLWQCQCWPFPVAVDMVNKLWRNLFINTFIWILWTIQSIQRKYRIHNWSHSVIILWCALRKFNFAWIDPHTKKR